MRGIEEKQVGVPELMAVRTVARTRFFRIEQMDLAFASGERRTYERLAGGGRSAVIVVALDADGDLLLIREYAAGFNEVQLTLVKGATEQHESLQDAANRELKEEVGFGARDIRFVKSLTVAPGHMGFTINVMLARDLYPESLPGDEPEPPELVRWPADRLDELFGAEDFTEARAIAALCMARPLLGC